ncbi:MAG: DUF2007 domain-containing protein [Acidobacteriota bacterium]|nr:DUF2007 domain-containing protein [Acidobacteriota bacterium]
MSNQPEINFVALAHFSNSVQAGMVSELLENNGIASILQGVNFGGLEPLLMPGGYSEITLLVAESELERAQQLYDAFFDQQADSVLAEDSELPEEPLQ